MLKTQLYKLACYNELVKSVKVNKKNMKTLRFKTSINCGNCINSVGPFINELENIQNWSVDTNNPDKILTIEGTEELTIEQVIAVVEDAGFDISALDNQ